MKHSGRLGDSLENLFNNIFRGKKVLVTGHTGFKGSWLSIWLNELGAEVIGFALDPYTEKDNFVKTGLKDRIIDIRGDVRDYKKLLKIIKEYEPEFVFHLAAQSLVGYSYTYPRETYLTNIMGTVNLLEAARRNKKVKVLINVTSDKCYQNRETVKGYVENDRLGGFDPYSSSKACSEIITEAYRNSYFKNNDNNTSVATVRAGNVIGGGDWAENRLIPDCVRALNKNRKIEVRNPDAVRPWQFVLDSLRGYLLLAEKLYKNPHEYSGAWNFGPLENSIITVGELVDKFVEKWGSGSWHTTKKREKFHEAKILKLNTEKSKKYLNWIPLIDINDALTFTANWYKKENISYKYNVEQVTKYLELEG